MGVRNPGNLLFGGVLATAAWIAWRNRESHQVSGLQVAAWIAVALSLPAIVVIEYAPWYSMLDFYGLPYVLGSAMLLAGAVSATRRLKPEAAPLIYAGFAGIMLCAGLHAVHTARDTFARREVDGAVAQYSRCIR